MRSKPQNPSPWLFAAGLAALAPWAVAGAAEAGWPPSTVAAVIALGFLPYGWLVTRESPALERPVLLAVGLAVLAGLPLVFAPPVLSDDLFRYLWDGRVLGAGIDPYRYAPDDPALAGLRDGLWQRVNHPRIPTIYPPLSQAFFFVADAIDHAPWTIKTLALAAHLAVIPVVARLAGPERPGAVFVYGLNPLALSESALMGHVDVFVGLALAAAVLALVRERPLRAAALAGAAAALKLVGALLLPLLFVRSRRAALLASVVLVCAIAPLVAAGAESDVTSGLGQYARRWRGNEGPYALVEATSEGIVSAAGKFTGAGRGRVRLTALRPVLEAAEGTPWDPRAALRGPKKSGNGDITVFSVRTVAGYLARGLVIVFVFGLAVALARRRVPPLVAARWTVLAALLLAPQVHPWYLLWLLPLEAAAGQWAVIAWSATCLVAYAPLDRWLVERVWVEHSGARLLEYAVVLGVLAWEAWPPKERRFRGVDPGLQVGKPAAETRY